MSIFWKNVDPLLTILHPTLGSLRWSQEEKEWAGEADGLAFCLSHEGGSEPTAELLAYAESLLFPPTLLLDGLHSERKKWLARYPNKASEIDLLKYEHITFYRQKGKNRVFAMLGPETDGRAWRVEFQEHRCTGLGFDT